MKKRILIFTLLALLFVGVFCLSSCGPQYPQEIELYMYDNGERKVLCSTILDEIINGDVRPLLPDCPPGKKLKRYYAGFTYYEKTLFGPVSHYKSVDLFDENLNPAPAEDFLTVLKLTKWNKIELSAEFQEGPYFHVFDTKEGSFANGEKTYSCEVYKGKYAKDIPIPTTREGYHFEGWYNEADVRVSGSGILPILTHGKYYDLNKATLNFYAKYAPDEHTLTVDYGLPDVENPTHKIYYDGEIPDLSGNILDIGTREIIGWSMMKDKILPLPEKVTGDITVYPIWQDYKNVDFQYLDGTVHTVKYSDTGEGAHIFPELKYPGYKLVSWLDGEGNAVGEASFDELQSVYTGEWEPIDYTLSFLCPDGTEAPADMHHTYGNATQLPLVEKAGYDFLGWYTDDPENCVFFLPADHWEDVTLTAKFAPRVFSVDLVAEGVTLTERFATATYGESYTVAPPPEREGYRFVGWFDAPEGGNPMTDAEGNSLAAWTSLDENKTFYAVWEEVPEGEAE